MNRCHDYGQVQLPRLTSASKINQLRSSLGTRCVLKRHDSWVFNSAFSFAGGTLMKHGMDWRFSVWTSQGIPGLDRLDLGWIHGWTAYLMNVVEIFPAIFISMIPLRCASCTWSCPFPCPGLRCKVAAGFAGFAAEKFRSFNGKTWEFMSDHHNL